MGRDNGEKSCAILLNMGGPVNTRDVPRYLYNVFSDRALIRLPGGRLWQKPFAKLISLIRTKKVQQRYARIGGSPLLRWTRCQAEQTEQIVAGEIPNFRCYVGMRYSPPTIAEAISEAFRDGCRDFFLLPLYPQFCSATTGSAKAMANNTLAELNGVKSQAIDSFYDDPGYISLLQKYINDHKTPEETLLFSVHAVPQSLVDQGDPYVDQIKQTAARAAGDREYYLGFQSRTGPVTWVGPDTTDEVRRLLEEKPGGVFIVPLSFVSDHLETLYELDIELSESLIDKNRHRVRRMPMFNGDPNFASVLAGIILRRWKNDRGI